MEDYEDDFVEDETCAANGFGDHTKRNIDPIETHHPNENPHVGFSSKQPCTEKQEDNYAVMQLAG